MKRILQLFLVLWFAACAMAAHQAPTQNYARQIAGLVDPAKLAKLRERGANPRVYKYVALLAQAKEEGVAPKKVAGKAVAITGMKGDAAKLTGKAMLRNLEIAERLRCLNADGLREMRQGRAPTVQRGPYRGDELSVDHIIPRAVVPELDNVMANLELMPLSANERKNAKVGARQLDLGRRLRKAGLLSRAGLKALEAAGR